MAAPEGNQFWKLASRHGRKTLFASPKKMWEAAVEYFEWCDENPLMEDTVEKLKINGEGEHITHEPVAKMRAYTWQGLCLYLNCNTEYFNHFEAALKGKEEKKSKDFSQTITRIRDIIYNQKFTGAAAGFLNPNIIARDLGLVDKKQQDVRIEQPLFGNEPEDESA